AKADDVHAPFVLDTVRHEQPFPSEPGALESRGGARVRGQYVRPQLLESERSEGDADEDTEGIRAAPPAPGAPVADHNAHPGPPEGAGAAEHNAHRGPPVAGVDAVEPDESDERAVVQAVDGEDGGSGRADQRAIPGLVLGPRHLAVAVYEPRHLGIIDPGAVA